MRDILTVMKFTINDMVKRKSFIISTIIILLFIIVGFNIPNIIKGFSGEDAKEKVIIVDNDNIFENKLSVLNTSEYYDIIVDNIDIKELKEKISNSEVSSGIIINKTNAGIELTYIVENLMFVDSIPEDLLKTIEGIYKNIQIEKLNLSKEQLQVLNEQFIISYDQTEEEVNGNVFAMMLLSILLFYAIYFCAYQVSSSITTEKTSKIMETLVTSTSPKNIVLGKTLGIGLVGLLQMVVFIGTALVCAKFFVDKALLEALLDVKSITISLGIITFIYFILGYFAFALLYALTGSTVSKPEDIQSANSPVALISVISFYLSYFTMMNPTSSLNRFAALFPLSSPFCMPFRIMMGISDGKEVFISLCILVITILIIAKVSIKIYSNAILNYGTKLKFKDIINIYKEK